MVNRRVAPATVQPRMRKKEKIHAPNHGVVGRSLSIGLSALYGIVHKSYPLDLYNTNLRVNRLLKKNHLVIILLLAALFTSIKTAPVLAGIPSVINIVVWNDSGNTALNVTVSHFPSGTPTHHVDAIEVNVSGTIETLIVPVISSTEFTVVFDLGPINGNPLATTRARCTIDGWTLLPYGPIEIPELSLTILLLALILSTTLSTSVYPRFRKKTVGKPQ